MEVDFLVRMGEAWNVLEIKSCSAFKEGEEIDCDRSCVYLPQAQETPSLFYHSLSRTGIITLWDLLYLKLGQDPHKTIPLFEGLRPSQAKIATLMGELKAFPQGRAIIRQGGMGNEMYVLLKGTADVFVNLSGQPRLVARLKRGDVFGEMGLIRHHESIADVIATEDVEVLAVNERSLSRIKQRYPRISVKIFLNLAKILSDRLEVSQRAAR